MVCLCCCVLQGIERFYDTVMQGLLRHVKFEGEAASASEVSLLLVLCECVPRLVSQS